MTNPTTRFPPTTNSPKVCIISPASACRSISLVVLMDRASRNSVVIRSTAGKAAKSSGAARYIATIKSITAMDILNAISTSMIRVGSGITSMNMMDTTKTARIISCLPDRAAEIRFRIDIA